MNLDAMKQWILALSEVSAWPQMVRLIERAVREEPQSIWEHPTLACRAVGGDAEAALPGAAAIVCSLVSIHLVDDILDDDPRGDYHELGTGPAANLALAFQAAAHRLLEDAVADAETRAALHARLARMALATAYGQNLDAEGAGSEAEYWRVVAAKAPPLFAAALSIGAILGGAPAVTAEQLERLGGYLGMFSQVSDDLVDALQTPARADWRRPFNNLPILYALTVEHPDREEFLRLHGRVEEPSALAAAQEILLRCGAVSYCAYRLAEISRQAREVFARIPLDDPEPLARLLDHLLTPLDDLLASVGFDGASRSAPN
jgi:geranylgeranyl diphosphate synthase type I